MAQNLTSWLQRTVLGLGVSLLCSVAVAQDAPTPAEPDAAAEEAMLEDDREPAASQENDPPASEDDAFQENDAPAATSAAGGAPESGEPAEESDEHAEDQVIRERFPSTAVKIERHVSQDSEGNYFNHGLWSQWDEKGSLIGSGEYRSGKRHGKWVRWYGPKEGEMFSSPLFSEFEGPFSSEAMFADGLLEGTWKVFDTKNRKVCEWEFEQGERHGKSVWYYPSGQKRREVDYRNGQIDGELVEWGPDNAATTQDKYLAGAKLAKQTEWYVPGQKLSEGWVLFAREITKSTYDWWDGVAAVSVVSKEGENQKHGQWTWWHKNGQKQMEGSYVDNTPVGKFTWWYANGQKQLQGEYVNGKQNGKFTWWHLNGQKQLEGEYVAGTQHGKWMRWTSEGKVVEVGEYTGENQETKEKEPDQSTAASQGVASPALEAARSEDGADTILK